MASCSAPAKTPKRGSELLNSGEFGRVGQRRKTRYGQSATTSSCETGASLGTRGRNLAKMVNERAYSTRPVGMDELMSDVVPNTNGTVVAAYGSNVYSGQFSVDSSFYYTCCQDFRMHIYDMTQPPVPYKPIRSMRYYDDETTMKEIKTVIGHEGWWTITDSHLSPDNERMIYSSHTPNVYMVKTKDSDPSQVPLNFQDRNGQDNCSIWSARFSADGKEVIAGGHTQIFVYDLLANKRTVKIRAHQDDVNSCCWADTASGNVLISASDDTFLKVWDRRSLSSTPKPSGVLVGHTEGITYVSAKGDGRYVISNGKDQTLRLWDLRKMRSSEEFAKISGRHYGSVGFDYRYAQSKHVKHRQHPNDCSVMAYQGHAIYSTLIRCHFSPTETTGGSYLFSGSADGRVYIWSLDGRLVQTLDRRWTLPMTRDPSAPEPMKKSKGFHRCDSVIRDVSWHSSEPVLMSAAWSDTRDRCRSSIARHEWKGLNKMGGRLEAWTEKQVEEAQERHKERERRRGGDGEEAGGGEGEAGGEGPMSRRTRRLMRRVRVRIEESDESDEEGVAGAGAGAGTGATGTGGQLEGLSTAEREYYTVAAWVDGEESQDDVDRDYIPPDDLDDEDEDYEDEDDDDDDDDYYEGGLAYEFYEVNDDEDDGGEEMELDTEEEMEMEILARGYYALARGEVEGDSEDEQDEEADGNGEVGTMIQIEGNHAGQSDNGEGVVETDWQGFVDEVIEETVEYL